MKKKTKCTNNKTLNYVEKNAKFIAACGAG